MVRFFAIKQLHVQITSRFVGKSLKKLPRQSETKRARHVLLFLRLAHVFEIELAQPAPNQAGTAAEIDDTSREAFIHRHIALASERIARIESRPVTANAFLVAQRLRKSLA